MLAFLPGARGDTRERARLLRTILGLSASFGLTLGALVAALPHVAPWLLTHDRAVWEAMRMTSLPAMLALALCGCEMALSGALIERGLFRAQTAGMLLTLGVTVAYFYTQWAALDIGVVWWGVALFFFTRTSFSALWLALFGRARDRGARVAAASA